jgi:hypothetical protein
MVYQKCPGFLTSNETGSSMQVSMFNKILLLNFDKTSLKPEYWLRMDKISKEKSSSKLIHLK